MSITQMRNLGRQDELNLIAFAPYAAGGAYVEANRAQGVLAIVANVANNEQVVIGSNTFTFKQLTTDTTRTALAIDGTSPVVLLTLSGAPAVALTAGDLVRIDNEIFKVDGVVDLATFKYRLIGGRSGTARAVHAGGASVFQAAVATTTDIPVGLNATLTPAVAIPALVAEINNAILTGGTRATSKASTIYDPGATYASGAARPDSERAGKVIAVAGPAADCVVVYSAIPENSVLATTETLGGANNAWVQGATMLGGLAKTPRRCMAFSKVPTAAEVTFGKLVFSVPFTPRAVRVDVTVTASGLAKAWVGAWLYDSTAKTLTVDNSGATDWAATDTVTVILFE